VLAALTPPHLCGAWRYYPLGSLRSSRRFELGAQPLLLLRVAAQEEEVLPQLHSRMRN
jgi:hypothetical protein